MKFQRRAFRLLAAAGLALSIAYIGNGYLADRSALLAAITKGDAPGVEAILQRHPKLVNASYPVYEGVVGKRPLHQAALLRRHAIARLLLDKGADPNAADGLGYTALHHAAFGGDRQMVMLLLRSGARADAPSAPNKAAPVDLAAEAGHFLLIPLFEAHSHCHTSPAHAAAILDDVPALSALSAPSQAVVGVRDGIGRTPLHYSAALNNLRAARWLLAHGADPGARDRRGVTALHLSAEYCAAGTARLLLQYKAFPAPMDVGLSTPLHEAARTGCGTLVKLLLAHGAGTSPLDQTHRTPLDLAVQVEAEDAVSVLTRAGARRGVR